MTIKELKEKLDELGVAYLSTAKKEELEGLLVESQPKVEEEEVLEKEPSTEVLSEEITMEESNTPIPVLVYGSRNNPVLVVSVDDKYNEANNKIYKEIVLANGTTLLLNDEEYQAQIRNK